MCLNFSLFFEKFLANELVNRTVKEKCAKECVRKLPTCDTSPVYSAGNTCTYTTKNTKRTRKQTGKGKKGAKKSYLFICLKFVINKLSNLIK